MYASLTSVVPWSNLGVYALLTSLVSYGNTGVYAYLASEVYQGHMGVYACLCVGCIVAYLHKEYIYTCDRVNPSSIVVVHCFGQTMLLIIF